MSLAELPLFAIADAETGRFIQVRCIDVEVIWFLRGWDLVEQGEKTSSEIQVELWNKARAFLNPIGRVPPSFTTPIRALLLDGKNGVAISPATQFLVVRLLKSPTAKAMFYYAALTFHGERLSNSAYLSSADLIRSFEPGEIAVIIAMLFLYRRAQKLGNLGGDEEWNLITKLATEKFEVGGHMGHAIPRIGSTKGMLVGGLRYITWAFLKMSDSFGFTRYLSHLEQKKRPYDLDYELDTWGCTHAHLLGNAMQLLGFGVQLSHAVQLGLGIQPPKDEKADEVSFEFALADEWIEVLYETGAEPQRNHLGQYYPREKDNHKMLYEITRLKEQGSKYNWLRRTQNDINPKDTPQLFQEFLMELQQSEAIQDFYKSHLPPEILDTLSEEELKELSAVEDEK